MKNLLKNKYFWMVIVVIAIIFIGVQSNKAYQNKAINDEIAKIDDVVGKTRMSVEETKKLLRRKRELLKLKLKYT